MAIIGMSRQHRGASNLDHILHEMTLEIAHSHVHSRQVLSSLSKSESHFKPKYIKKLFRPQPTRHLSSPTE